MNRAREYVARAARWLRRRNGDAKVESRYLMVPKRPVVPARIVVADMEPSRCLLCGQIVEEQNTAIEMVVQSCAVRVAGAVCNRHLEERDQIRTRCQSVACQALVKIVNIERGN